MPLNLMERSASLTLLKLSDTFILVDLYQIPPVLVKVQQFPTLAAINVFFWRFFRHWNRPTSVFCEFTDVGRDQRLFFQHFQTLATTNVSIFAVSGHWPAQTSFLSEFPDVGLNQRPGNRKKKTLASVNVRIL